MNHFDIEWNQFQETVRPAFWHANVLGYYVKVFPIVGRTPERSTRYCATHDEAGEAWPIGSGDGYWSVDEAKAAVDTWLASRVRELRAGAGQQLRSETQVELTVGLGYALKFLDSLRTRLSASDCVEVVPVASAEGESGLYFRNESTGYGVRILSSTRKEYVTMSTGVLSDLDEALDENDRISTTYFHETEMASYARVAAKMYLSDGREIAGRMYHPGPTPARLSERQNTPGVALDLFDLLSRLVGGDVGRQTLNTLSTGQGTETEDGKNWLTAAATVERLKAGL